MNVRGEQVYIKLKIHSVSVCVDVDTKHYSSSKQELHSLFLFS